MANNGQLYHVWVYVPQDAKERVKAAMFEAGAGAIGNYRACSWETKGTGQFMPLEGSAPAIGSLGRLENVDEYKVEMVVSAAFLNCVIAAMKSAHPYEEPAYGAVLLADV